MKKVSVVIPTYNRSKYICEAIESALAQTFQDFEVIVVDDGSNDDTRQRIERYLPEIKYIYQENAGVSAARNTGIAASEGEYVAFLDSDDLWIRDKLKLQVEFMDSRPQFGMVFTDCCMFRGEQIVWPSYFRERQGLVASGDIFDNLIRESFIITSTVLVRRELLHETGMFDESFFVAEDYDMWLRIARRCPIGAMDICQVKYRLHDASLTSTADTIYFDMMIRMLKKHERYLYRNDTKRYVRRRLAEFHFDRGYMKLDQGNNRSAAADLLHSLRYGNLGTRTLFLLLLTLMSPDSTDKVRHARRRLLAEFKKLEEYLHLK